MNNMLTAAQVTSQFLYGTDTPPTGSALIDQNLVGRTTAGTLPKLDTITFMTDGPGKFAKPSQSYLVTAFFNDGLGFPPIQPGSSMSASAYAALNGLELGYRVTQLFYSESGESQANIAERVYIFNTQDYGINPDAMFVVTEVVDALGNKTIVKSIENLNVIMPADDNFDFEGGRTSQVAALFLEPRVDPWNIGVKVQEDYTLPTYNIGSYSEAQWVSDTSYILSVYHPITAPAGSVK